MQNLEMLSFLRTLAVLAAPVALAAWAVLALYRRHKQFKARQSAERAALRMDERLWSSGGARSEAMEFNEYVRQRFGRR